LLSGILIGIQSAGSDHKIVCWDAAKDFSISNGNPNGAWSYGCCLRRPNGTPGPFTCYALSSTGFLSIPLVGWHSESVDPNVTFNPIEASLSKFGITWEPKQISIGPAYDFSGLRWTAPSNGTFRVVATFTDDQVGGDGADVFILKNGSIKFHGSPGVTLGKGCAFTSELQLNAGDHLDFMVGSGEDKNPFGDNTAVTIVITTSRRD
jgi:hypothetical protein